MINKTNLALIVTALLALAACSGSDGSDSTRESGGTKALIGSGAPTSQTFLQEVGFNEPLTVTVRPSGVGDLEPTGIRHFYFDGSRSLGIVSLLAKAGRVRPVTDTSKDTGWRMSAPGADAGGNITVVIGRRVVTGRTNRRNWSEGATKYFAETINYNVQRSSEIGGGGPENFGPFSFRLVLVNDPAVGEWRVDPQASERPGQENEQVIGQVSEEGIAVLGDLAEMIRVARGNVGQQQTQARTSGPVPSQNAVEEISAPAEPYIRRLLTAPARTSGGSPWVMVPAGRKVMFCEANGDLSCKDDETDINAVGFEFQCRNLRGTVLAWGGRCGNLIAIRVRSKSDTPLVLATWFEPA